MRALVKLVAVGLLVLSLGLHWALLQTVAWASMLVTYSRNASLQVAVQMTFDGEHPCALCREIQRGRSAERQAERQTLPATDKLELAVLAPGAIDLPGVSRRHPPALECLAARRSEEPPKPRPRRSNADPQPLV